MPKITIIDGNSLLFRAYYATAYPGVEIMRNQDGIPTNAVFSFSNMLNKIVSTLSEGESIMVAFDAGKHNFRHDQLETYKANRKPAPEELVQQFPIAREFLRAIGIFQFEQVGFEGDDIAGTMAKRAEQAGYDVTLYTSDRDFLQLVTDKITVRILKKGLSDVMDMTPSLVKEVYGFEPLQIIDYKGLRGDTSDNLPGIPGVGEKTAVQLIEQYGSFDNIIAHASEIKGKLGQKILENQEIGRISRDLAIIRTDIEVPFTLEDTVYKGYDFQEISEFCKKYGLKQFMTKLQPKWKRVDPTEFNMDIKKVSDLPEDINGDIGLAIDLSDDNYTDADIYGISIFDKKNVYYIELEDAKKSERFLKALKDENIGKYTYNFKAIKVALAREGIEVNGPRFDLLIAAYLIDSSTKDNVDLVMNIFGVDISSSEEETVSLFSSSDVEKTAKTAYFSNILASKAENELNKLNALNLFKDLEMPLTSCLAKMEIEGFPLDAKTLDSFGDKFKEKLEVLTKEIYELAGEEFNIASPKQVGDILFNKLGLKGNKKMSTSVEVLKELEKDHPIVPKLLEYRKYFKLITTYVDGLKVHIHKDGRIHPKFNQAQTTTGRLSSSDPNLQNISTRDEESKVIRKAFTFENTDYSLISLDYSQIELRVMAHLSKCKGLIDIFKSGEDIHAATAKKIFNLQEAPTYAQRRRAKAVNFGIIYGISEFGLSQDLDISFLEARNLIDTFYQNFPEIREFLQNVVSEASTNGYVSTLFNRRRYLTEITDSNYQKREFAKRAAMNAPIQGTAADLIKIAMIKVDQYLSSSNIDAKMIGQVHDELLIQVKDEYAQEVYNEVKHIMETVVEFEVPLEVDGGIGKDWADAK